MRGLFHSKDTARLIHHVSAYPWSSGRRENKVVLIPSQPARWRSQTPTLLHRLPITSSSRPRHSTRPSYTQRSSGRASGPESLEPLVFGRTSLRARARTTRSTCTRLPRKRRPRDCTAKQTRRLPCRRQNLVSREPFGFQCSIVAKFTTAEVAATVKSSLAPLRSIQHRDSLGNPIGTVPDNCRKPWRKANPSSAHSRSRPFKSNAEQMGTSVRHDPEFRGRN